MSYPYATVHLTVRTESGAEYLIRQHGQRAYVTRTGIVAMRGEAPVNRVTTKPIHLKDGDAMVVAFDDGRVLRTTTVVDIDWTVQTYSR